LAAFSALVEASLATSLYLAAFLSIGTMYSPENELECKPNMIGNNGIGGNRLILSYQIKDWVLPRVLYFNIYISGESVRMRVLYLDSVG